MQAEPSYVILLDFYSEAGLTVEPRIQLILGTDHRIGAIGADPDLSPLRFGSNKCL